MTDTRNLDFVDCPYQCANFHTSAMNEMRLIGLSAHLGFFCRCDTLPMRLGIVRL
jgi:hypothetical protein